MLREGLLFLSGSSAAKKVLTGVPITRSMSRRFVPGETVDALVTATGQANEDGLKVTANYLGESVHSEGAARAAASVYADILDRVIQDDLDATISVKFTQLGQDVGDEFLHDNLTPLLEKADQASLFIRFDMESSAYTERTLGEFEKLWAAGWREIGVVLQSYLFRTAGDVRRMIDLGARVRLCKGAYAEPAAVAFQERSEVDRSFVDLMQMLLAEGNYPGIATHDERMIDATVDFASREGIGAERFEFQMLYGVRRDLQKALVEDGYTVRAYIPFGESWYPYLMRRLAERPANVLFLAGSLVQESPLGFLWPGGNGRR